MTALSTRDRYRAFAARYLDKPTLALPLPPWLMRMIFEAQSGISGRAPSLPVRWEVIGGVRCRIVAPDGPVERRLLWLHGGGFVIGSPRTHRALTDRLAQVACAEVIAPDYRLAPEHPFPAAVEDCCAVARALAPGFHLGGDSAGGTLALAVLQEMLSRGASPATLLLISPLAYFDPRRRPAAAYDEMLLPDAFLRRCGAAYGTGADPDDPRLSPIKGDYAGCPPVHIELSKGEVLEADGLALADLLRAQGTAVDVVQQPGMPHVYHLSAGFAPAADAGVARLAAAMGA
ncbi:MAG: alpha/beta hydrolase [Pseudomonadota bacterium]